MHKVCIGRQLLAGVRFGRARHFQTGSDRSKKLNTVETLSVCLSVCEVSAFAMPLESRDLLRLASSASSASSPGLVRRRVCMFEAGPAGSPVTQRIQRRERRETLKRSDSNERHQLVCFSSPESSISLSSGFRWPASPSPTPPPVQISGT